MSYKGSLSIGLITAGFNKDVQWTAEVKHLQQNRNVRWHENEKLICSIIFHVFLNRLRKELSATVKKIPAFTSWFYARLQGHKNLRTFDA